MIITMIIRAMSREFRVFYLERFYRRNIFFKKIFLYPYDNKTRNGMKYILQREKNNFDVYVNKFIFFNTRIRMYIYFVYYKRKYGNFKRNITIIIYSTIRII